MPFRVLAPIAKDGYRKPNLGTWYALQKIFEQGNVIIGEYPVLLGTLYCVDTVSLADTASSFYVGDAAGRDGDHECTDRKYALNAGLGFFTPEVRVSAPC